jgi:hypothetical protein
MSRRAVIAALLAASPSLPFDPAETRAAPYIVGRGNGVPAMVGVWLLEPRGYDRAPTMISA